jgi:hypothetical protein
VQLELEYWNNGRSGKTEMGAGLFLIGEGKLDSHLLFRDEHEAKERALAAKQRGLTEYNLEKLASKYYEEYQALVSRK